MGEKGDLFGRARLDAMLEAIGKGKKSTEELYEAARMAENNAIQAVGEKSERRFNAYARHLKIVKSVREGSPADDLNGIDKWITLSDIYKLPELPVQVKSSFKDVRKFKKDDRRFLNRRMIEIVVNCGPSVKPRVLKNQLLSEIRRIKDTLGVIPQ